MKAINDFWFPPSTAKTTILKFVQTVDEVGGDDIVAYVRGRSEVAWRIEDKKTTDDWSTAGNYMAILKKQADGKWLISHLIWDDPPNQPR
jgi:ketosteroid isomerase-like protein